MARESALVPRLTVEAFAEMMTLPGHQQVRVLNEQKYPKRAPAMFMVPYYQPALKAIRRFYQKQNDHAVITGQIEALASLGLKSRPRNNIRV